MSQTDFIIGFGVLIVLVSFTIFYISSNYSSEFNSLLLLDLKESSYQLEQLLKDSLSDNFKKINSYFKEIGGEEHRERIGISIEIENIDKIHVYDDLMNEIPSDVIRTGKGVNVFFFLDFDPNEEKFVNIFYYGGSSTDLKYLGNPEENNVIGRILSEYNVNVIPNEKCNLDYDQFRNSLDFENQFKINLTECSIGPEPPETNVIVKNIPILFENSNELMIPENMRVLTW